MKKNFFLLLAMITLINSGYAQVVHPFRAENVYNTLKEGIATDLEHRNDMARLLSTMDTLITGQLSMTPRHKITSTHKSGTKRVSLQPNSPTSRNSTQPSSSK